MTRPHRRAVSFTLVAGALVPTLLVVSCSVPGIDLASKKCATTTDCNAGQVCNTGTGACADVDGSVGFPDGGSLDSAMGADALMPVDLCNSIPYFSGSQVVDGDGSDFSSVPTENYPWRSIPTSNNTFNGPADPLDVTAKVGWSSVGMHLFFHVHYEDDGGADAGDTLVVPFPSDPLWYGDAVEIFIKGDTSCTGNFGSTEDVGALHLIASPDPTNPPRTATFASDAGETTDLVASDAVAAHQDSDGYDLEFLVPWADVIAPDAGAPAAGQKIAFDFGVDYRNRLPEAGSNQPSFQLLLAVGPQDPTSCMFGAALPPCDDRTWCTPVLVAP
jgi:hypothetical protein